MNKSEIRQQILHKRDIMTPDDVRYKSFGIYQSLKNLFLYKFDTFLLYSDFKNEVCTSDITDYLISVGSRVYLPVCDTKRHTFSAVEIHGKSDIFNLNKYGIKEPATVTQKCDADKCKSKCIDCAIVPGVAFDRNCNRIGFGAGYYDRFFENNPNCFKIALAYDFQIINGTIASCEHDVKMDVIVTEKRVISFDGKEL